MMKSQMSIYKSVDSADEVYKMVVVCIGEISLSMNVRVNN